jgi:hypothetical protein
MKELTSAMDKALKEMPEDYELGSLEVIFNLT